MASGVLANLTVRLGMDTAEFTSKVMRAQSQADRFIGDLKRQADTFGMTAREAKRYQLALSGATAEQLAQIRSLDEHITKMERAADEEARAAQEARSLSSAQRMLGRDIEQTANKLDLFGKRGFIKQTFDLLRGGGAIIGLGILARTLNEASEKFVESQRAGEDWRISILGSIPIVNNFAQSIMRLRDSFDASDNSAAMAEMDKQIEERRSLYEKVNAAVGAVIQEVDPDRARMEREEEKRLELLRLAADASAAGYEDMARRARDALQMLADSPGMKLIQKQLEDMRDRVREQYKMEDYVASFGRPESTYDKVLNKALADGFNGTEADAFAKQAAFLEEQEDEIREENRRREQAKSIIDRNRTAKEVFDDRVAQAKSLFDKLPDEQITRELSAALQDFQKASGFGGRSDIFTGAPGLNLAGTAQATSAERVSRAADTVQRAAAERLLGIQAESKRILEDIKRDMRRTADAAAQPADVG